MLVVEDFSSFLVVTHYVMYSDIQIHHKSRTHKNKLVIMIAFCIIVT